MVSSGQVRPDFIPGPPRSSLQRRDSPSAILQLGCKRGNGINLMLWLGLKNAVTLSIDACKVCIMAHGPLYTVIFN